MKKILLCCAFVSIIQSLFGMDKLVPVYSDSINGTKVEVVYNDCKKIGYKEKRDITVVGKHEQRFLAGDLANDHYIGDVSCSTDKSMLIKSELFKLYLNKCYHSRGILVNHRFAGYKDCEIFKLCTEPAYRINIDGIVLKVIEPKLLTSYSEYMVGSGMAKLLQPLSESEDCCLEQKITSTSYVYPKIVHRDGSDMLLHYFDGEAIEKALEDLSQCYANVLERSHKLFTLEHQEKSITFPFLSSLLGVSKDDAAKVAVSSLITFLTKDSNKGKYGLIEFVVEQMEDVDLYEKYLKEYAAQVNKK